MGFEESGRPRGEGGDKTETTALEQRVARLELELAALQRRFAGGAEAGAASARTASYVEPPPMPVVAAKQVSAAASEGSVAQRSGKLTWPVKAADAGSRQSLEDRLGSQIFNRVAIVLLLIGTAYGLKLVVDHGWIGPAERVLIGLVAGVGLVVWSERFRSKGFAAFSYSLKAVGSGILYLSLWASFQMFHLLSAPVALAMMVLVTGWNAFMAWTQDSELLAGYALVGGFAAPLLVSTGGNHEIFLFTYLIAIDVATVALVRMKRWPRLLVGAFPATVLFFIGWYAEFFAAEMLVVTSCFVVVFGSVFGSVPIGRGRGRSSVDAAAELPAEGRAGSFAVMLKDVLLPIFNAAFLALALYWVLQDSGHHAALPWLMVALGAAYLGLMRAPQTATAAAIHLSLAVVLLTIAVPLKASGHWITVCWLMEGLAMTWVAARVGEDEREGYGARTLRWLATASLLLGFGGICVHVSSASAEWNSPQWNKAMETALSGIAAFAGAAWLALRGAGEADERLDDRREWSRIAKGTMLLIAATAGLLTLREIIISWFMGNAGNLHLPFRSADFISAAAGLVVLAGVVMASLTIRRQRPGDWFWETCAGGTTMAFNVIAVFTGVREVSALWNTSPGTWSADDALKQALAVSAFLMLYGTALLAAGFWKRSALLRWQALGLLVITICKTFLYDMRSLSQGYRVASVLGLGVVLMAISFAYQKDWLDLSGPEGEGVGSDGEDEGERVKIEGTE